MTPPVISMHAPESTCRIKVAMQRACTAYMYNVGHTNVQHEGLYTRPPLYEQRPGNDDPPACSGHRQHWLYRCADDGEIQVRNSPIVKQRARSGRNAHNLRLLSDRHAWGVCVLHPRGRVGDMLQAQRHCFVEKLARLQWQQPWRCRVRVGRSGRRPAGLNCSMVLGEAAHPPVVVCRHGGYHRRRLLNPTGRHH